MEWIQDDSLLQAQDLKVLKFSATPKPSIILKITQGRQGNTLATSQDLESPETWHKWLEEVDTAVGRKEVTILLGGRTVRPIPGNEVSYLPFPEALRDHIVSAFQIHRSISRVINRSTTAICSATTSRDAGTGELLQIYNCRSSSEWKDDMALSVTHFHDNRSTRAVLYGCTDKIRNNMINRLKKCNYIVYHPLSLPTLFCDIERDRHFSLVNPVITKLVGRAVNIAKPQRRGSVSSRSTRSNGTSLNQGAAIERNSESLMDLWLQMSDLKRGLETWKQQLENLILHCEDLLGGAQPRQPAGCFDDPEKCEYLDSGRRIHRRLVELKCEYDDKIRQCVDIIDGTVLAAQLEWNNIGQADTQTNLTISDTNLEIAKATQADSRQMRSISFLTMVFLPATFVATVFSMTFFNWSPDEGQKIMSPWFWVYVAVTAGFTLVTMCIWFSFNRYRKSKSNPEDVEGQSVLSSGTTCEKDR